MQHFPEKDATLFSPSLPLLKKTPYCFFRPSPENKPTHPTPQNTNAALNITNHSRKNREKPHFDRRKAYLYGRKGAPGGRLIRKPI